MGVPARQIVAAVVRRGKDILLGRQRGPDDREAGWALPGGVVERGESLSAALVREVREETGLVVSQIGRLVSVASGPGVSTAFTFEVEAEGSAESVDPDGLVLEARWIPVERAPALLSTAPTAPMREPVVAFLEGCVAVPTRAKCARRRAPDSRPDPRAGPGDRGREPERRSRLIGVTRGS